MKKNLLFNTSGKSTTLGSKAKVWAAAGIIALFSSFNASAQWVVYEGNVLPNDYTASPFVTSNVNPAIDEANPAIVASEQSIMDDASVAGNKLLSFKTTGAPHTSFMWRQNFAAAPNSPSAATVVVRAKGMEGVDRVLELDMDFGGYRETIFINNNNTFSFNVVRGDLVNVTLGDNFDVMQWHTYRVTKTGGTTSLYIDESNTPIATGTSTTGGRTQNYFRFGDGQSSASYGAMIDYIVWDQSGSYSPSQLALPSAVVLFAKGDMEKAGRLSVYPNPSTDRFVITHPAVRKGATIEVYAANGVKITSIAAENGSTSTNLDLSARNNGLYTIVYAEGSQRSTSRIIKQ